MADPLVVLSEFFADVDDVFTAGEWKGDHARQALSRCFDAWRKARAALDPEFDPSEYRR